MVNKEHIKLWVDALKSGNYEQSDGSLKNDRGYCCLGVACEVYIAAEDKLTTDARFENHTFFDASTDDKGETAMLPLSVMKWLGFESNDPCVDYIQDEYDEDLEEFTGEKVENNDSLSCLNDDKNFDFHQIAEVLKENFLKEE